MGGRIGEILLVLGLVVIGFAFVAVDRGWWTIEPVWMVDEPIAGGIGILGLACFGLGLRMRRRDGGGRGEAR